ncbi:MAG: radical SAM protein, partial [Victivallales bacterium]|nr:radical SAM protein [Victivallales bacterium]
MRNYTKNGQLPFSEFKPTLIGVTIFSYCYSLAFELILKIEKCTDIPIVAGGAHVSAVGAKMLTDSKVDFAVKQEGEFTLLELLKEYVKGSRDFSGINGLIWRDSKGMIIENPNRKFIEDLDALPFPDYESFGIERYVCFKQKTLPLITSRGCPFGCNYCSVRLSMGQRFRARSAENVFSEIKHFYDKGYRSFDFNDDCFTLDNGRAESICDLIIKNRLVLRFQLYNGIRVDTVTLELLKKMKKAGCFFVSFGCEAGNNKVLKAIKKGITIEQVRQAVDWANQAGIRNSVNFIIGH